MQSDSINTSGFTRPWTVLQKVSNSTFLASDLFLYDYKSNIFLIQERKKERKTYKKAKGKQKN